MDGQGTYVGRFAPSPTGPLHLGSLISALASFLDARHEGGRWLLRIEDLDPPRESTSAPATIIRQLEACGLAFDGGVLYQSSRLDAYEAALEELTDMGLTYPCTCSRASLAPVYAGTCRHKRFDHQHGPYAVRLRVDDHTVAFADRVAGPQRCHLGSDVGDFIIKRRDGYFAYQLAVVVDDAWQDITHVVRGRDLLDSTPRQLYLTRCLGHPPIEYCHIPIIVNARGAKLSKQNRAEPIDTDMPVAVLKLALRALGQEIWPGLDNRDLLLARAIDAWNVDAVPRTAAIPMSRLARQNE